jgi:hypothetical protein
MVVVATAGAVKPKTATVPPVPSTAPPETAPVVTSGPTEVHAAIGTGFAQNPVAPDEATWSFSASATQTVTNDGVPRTETVPLPAGELAFFVDGKLECEIHAVGAIDGSACTSVEHGDANRLPEYLAVGQAPDNIQPEYGFEVGRVRITGRSIRVGSRPSPAKASRSDA